MSCSSSESSHYFWIIKYFIIINEPIYNLVNTFDYTPFSFTSLGADYIFPSTHESCVRWGI